MRNEIVLSVVMGVMMGSGVSVRGWELPELPKMPEVGAPRAEGSVVMGDPKDFAEVKMDFPIAAGPYEGSWESIGRQYPAEAGGPGWLREAKFGIWVHFGAQSAGESGDWYAKRLYEFRKGYLQHPENHRKRFGHPSEVGYKEVLHTWNPSKLDPAGLVALYKEAGAKFLFIQGVHHDNFDMWDSKYQPWNSVAIGPHRDLLKEWTGAARGAGMHYGIAFHHEYTWWWWQTAFGADKEGPKAGVPYDGNLTLKDGVGKWWEGLDPRLLYTVNLREYQGLDVEFAPKQGIFQNHQEYAKWYATWWALRMMDAIEKYDPDFIYTDGNSTGPFSGYKSGTGMKCDAMARVMAHYFNRTLERRGKVDTFGIVKFSPPRAGVVNTQEGVIPKGIKEDQPWIGETAVGDWFYAPGFVYDAGAVVRYVVENAARDGATAICVSQLPDGSLDEGSTRMLKEVGAWMKVNGEGIYGSRAWKVLGEGEGGKVKAAPNGKIGKKQAEAVFGEKEMRFTEGKDGAVYVWCLKVPAAGSEVRVESLGTGAGLMGDVKGVEMLGAGAVEWRREEGALVVKVPARVEGRLVAGFRVR